MPDSEIQSLRNEIGDLKKSVGETDEKVQRLLNWAQADTDLGKLSISQQIDNLERQLKVEQSSGNQLRQDYKVLLTRVEQNDESIKENQQTFKDIRQQSALAGGGSGGAVGFIVTFLKNIFTS